MAARSRAPARCARPARGSGVPVSSGEAPDPAAHAAVRMARTRARTCVVVRLIGPFWTPVRPVRVPLGHAHDGPPPRAESPCHRPCMARYSRTSDTPTLPTVAAEPTRHRAPTWGTCPGVCPESAASRASRPRRRHHVRLALGAVTPTVAPTPVRAAPSPDVVISQVYGGGGNTGAFYANDFIELYNRGGTTVDLTGWSVQYAAAGGTTWSVTALHGQIPPGQYYLVQQAAGTGGGTPLPAPDATGSTSVVRPPQGKVALVTTASALTCGADCDAATGVRDFVGYGAAERLRDRPDAKHSRTRIGRDPQRWRLHRHRQQLRRLYDRRADSSKLRQCMLRDPQPLDQRRLRERDERWDDDLQLHW